MTEDIVKYFKPHKDTPPINVKGDYRCSARRGNTYRLDWALKQADLPPVSPDLIVSYVNEFLQKAGMKTIEDAKMDPKEIDHAKIKKENNLKKESDIVWMKFTEKGHLGVVAKGDDINFKLPESPADYNKGKWEVNKFTKKKEWVYTHNTSGILVHQVGQSWDRSFVLVFPLPNMPEGYCSGDFETAIGNYLIEKGVPIIDFFSHNY